MSDEFDGVSSDTLNVPDGSLNQILELIRGRDTAGDAYLSVDRIVVRTDDGGLEFTADGGAIEVRETDE